MAKLLVRELPADERPRERLEKFGPAALSDAELLALILRTGTRRENVLDVARMLLKKFDLISISQAEVKSLSSIAGIKRAKAAQLVACFELGRRAAAFTKEKIRITNSEAAAKLLIPKMAFLKKEHFKVLILNSKNFLLKEETACIGSLNVFLARPADVFKSPLVEGAAAVILAHNHPSGDVIPSKEDVAVTKKLAKAGQLLGIEVLDHIIIGGKEYTSLKEEGVF